MHRFRISASLGLALALASCTGNAMTPTPAVPAAPAAHIGPSAAASAHSFSSIRASAVANCGDCTASFEAVDGIGGAVGALGVENAAERPPKNPQPGMCMNGTKLFAPDRSGDPNSAEVQVFYDAGCTQLSRDTVRRFNHDSKCDTVNVTVKNYSVGGSLLSTRMSTVDIMDGVREAQSSFTIGKRKIDSSIELIVMPSTGNVANFCGDWAGYNATGVGHTSNTTFGWAGGFVSGTRTLNGDGSVTWNGKRDTIFYEGHLGHLKIVQGSYNSACPISKPAYTIGGGTAQGTSTGTTMATFYNGVLQCLFVSRTSISGNYYVEAESHKGVSPNSPDFITGTVSHNGKVVSTFSINSIGNGTLTVKSTGCTFNVAGWTVVRS